MHTMAQLSSQRSDSFIFEVAPRMDRAGSERPLCERGLCQQPRARDLGFVDLVKFLSHWGSLYSIYYNQS